ncbi:MAG: hypothetical protein K6E33_04525 [Lachnospiraceae bacterium]|nr:hypothetical protein [Lachnospiraceae bacterium]
MGKIKKPEPKTKEEIGSVIVDISKYSGDDRYCDGEVEDEILSIAKKYAEPEYPEIIEEKKNWPVLYHLSKERENIVEWLPIQKDQKVLEVGAGCGAVTGMLSKKAAKVDCAELSLKRSRINAYRHADRDNIVIYVGNFTDTEPSLPCDYDWIILTGVLEYAGSYVDDRDPYVTLLKLLKKHLAPGGRMATAIENRLGLKYFAGCREDHVARYFAGIEGYTGNEPAVTFSRGSLKGIFESAGFSEDELSFYYPYPDYKFMRELYSDRRLPLRGELCDNIRNFDMDRLLLFDEGKAFDALISDGLFREFSNSFMVLTGPEPDTVYVRYSGERAPEYRIKTEEHLKENEHYVLKAPLTEEARSHVEQMAEVYPALRDRYEGGGLKLCPCTKDAEGRGVRFEHCKGTTLARLMSDAVSAGDELLIRKLFHRYVKLISYGDDNCEITDSDLLFSNIMVDGDNWTAIDYEWTDNENVPVMDVAFRALYCFALTQPEDSVIPGVDDLIEELGITQKRMDEIRRGELAFQKKVTGNRLTLGEIRERIGNRIYTASDLKTGENLRNEAVVYEDTGHGFNEEETVRFEDAHINYEVPSGRRALRVDPCSYRCILKIGTLSFMGREITDKEIRSNGLKLSPGLYAFDTEDPWIEFDLDRTGLPGGTLIFEAEASHLTEGIAEALSGVRVKRGIF